MVRLKGNRMVKVFVNLAVGLPFLTAWLLSQFGVNLGNVVVPLSGLAFGLVLIVEGGWAQFKRTVAGKKLTGTKLFHSASFLLGSGIFVVSLANLSGLNIDMTSNFFRAWFGIGAIILIAEAFVE